MRSSASGPGSRTARPWRPRSPPAWPPGPQRPAPSADICSTVLDADGSVLEDPRVADSCVSITTDQLRRIPHVIAIAGGAEKAPAIAAALRAGLVHTLVTDQAAARLLLDSDS